MSSFWDAIKEADLNLLYIFNVKLQSPFMDQFWLFITDMHKSKILMFVVLPLLLARIVYIYRWKTIRPILALAMTVAVSDSLAYRVVKPMVERPRPFMSAETSSWIRKVGRAAPGHSFPSNHAANCFAAATVLSWYFRRQALGLYTFAGLIGLSRVALGVHYPTDVLGGAILGIIVGLLITSQILSRIPWLSRGKRVPRRDNTSWNWRSRSRRLMSD